MFIYLKCNTELQKDTDSSLSLSKLISDKTNKNNIIYIVQLLIPVVLLMIICGLKYYRKRTCSRILAILFALYMIYLLVSIIFFGNFGIVESSDEKTNQKTQENFESTSNSTKEVNNNLKSYEKSSKESVENNMKNIDIKTTDSELQKLLNLIKKQSLWKVSLGEPKGIDISCAKDIQQNIKNINNKLDAIMLNYNITQYYQDHLRPSLDSLELELKTTIKNFNLEKTESNIALASIAGIKYLNYLGDLIDNCIVLEGILLKANQDSKKEFQDFLRALDDYRQDHKDMDTMIDFVLSDDFDKNNFKIKIKNSSSWGFDLLKKTKAPILQEVYKIKILNNIITFLLNQKKESLVKENNILQQQFTNLNYKYEKIYKDFQDISKWKTNKISINMEKFKTNLKNLNFNDDVLVDGIYNKIQDVIQKIHTPEENIAGEILEELLLDVKAAIDILIQNASLESEEKIHEILVIMIDKIELLMEKTSFDNEHTNEILEQLYQTVEQISLENLLKTKELLLGSNLYIYDIANTNKVCEQYVESQKHQLKNIAYIALEQSVANEELKDYVVEIDETKNQTDTMKDSETEGNKDNQTDTMKDKKTTDNNGNQTDTMKDGETEDNKDNPTDTIKDGKTEDNKTNTAKTEKMNFEGTIFEILNKELMTRLGKNLGVEFNREDFKEYSDIDLLEILKILNDDEISVVFLKIIIENLKKNPIKQEILHGIVRIFKNKQENFLQYSNMLKSLLKIGGFVSEEKMPLMLELSEFLIINEINNAIEQLENFANHSRKFNLKKLQKFFDIIKIDLKLNAEYLEMPDLIIDQMFKAKSHNKLKNNILDFLSRNLVSTETLGLLFVINDNYEQKSIDLILKNIMKINNYSLWVLSQELFSFESLKVLFNQPNSNEILALLKSINLSMLQKERLINNPEIFRHHNIMQNLQRFLSLEVEDFWNELGSDVFLYNLQYNLHIIFNTLEKLKNKNLNNFMLRFFSSSLLSENLLIHWNNIFLSLDSPNKFLNLIKMFDLNLIDTNVLDFIKFCLSQQLIEYSNLKNIIQFYQESQLSFQDLIVILSFGSGIIPELEFISQIDGQWEKERYLKHLKHLINEKISKEHMKKIINIMQNYSLCDYQLNLLCNLIKNQKTDFVESVFAAFLESKLIITNSDIELLLMCYEHDYFSKEDLLQYIYQLPQGSYLQAETFIFNNADLSKEDIKLQIEEILTNHLEGKTFQKLQEKVIDQYMKNKITEVIEKQSSTSSQFKSNDINLIVQNLISNEIFINQILHNKNIETIADNFLKNNKFKEDLSNSIIKSINLDHLVNYSNLTTSLAQDNNFISHMLLEIENSSFKDNLLENHQEIIENLVDSKLQNIKTKQSTNTTMSNHQFNALLIESFANNLVQKELKNLLIKFEIKKSLDIKEIALNLQKNQDFVSALLNSLVPKLQSHSVFNQIIKQQAGDIVKIECKNQITLLENNTINKMQDLLNILKSQVETNQNNIDDIITFLESIK